MLCCTVAMAATKAMKAMKTSRAPAAMKALKARAAMKAKRASGRWPTGERARRAHKDENNLEKLQKQLAAEKNLSAQRLRLWQTEKMQRIIAEEKLAELTPFRRPESLVERQQHLLNHNVT